MPVKGSCEVRTAAELFDAQFIAKWRDRAGLDALPREVLGAVLDGFIASDGAVAIETVVSRLADRDPAEVRGAMVLLDEKDLLLARDGEVLLAYPFSGVPNAFRVVFPDGRQRHACCAIDALGVAPMLGHPVTVRSRCHHCGEALELSVRPDGPVGNREAMVWVGDRGDIRGKGATLPGRRRSSTRRLRSAPRSSGRCSATCCPRAR
jgi:hypothetical protein